MGERELREKYGGHLAKAINRAIRAEVAGGNEALERLTHLAGAARQSHWADAQGRKTPEAAAYFRHKRDVVGRMDAEVRKRWGLPPAEQAAEEEMPGRKPRGRGGKPRQRGGRTAPSPRRQGAARQAGKRTSGGRWKRGA